MQRRVHHGSDSPLKRGLPKEKQKQQRKRQHFKKNIFKEPSIDWGHRPGSLGINQLVCTPVVDLLNNIRSFPLWLELSLRLVRDDDGSTEHEDQLALPEYALLDELVISSHHILAVMLQVL